MAAQAEIKAVITAKDEASSVLQGFGNSVRNNAGAIMAGAAAVGAAVLAMGVISVNAFGESEAASAQLSAVLKSTGGQAGVTADEAKNLASALQETTRYSDEAVLSAENMLLTFTNIGKDIFPETTRAVADMSTAMGQDLKQTSIQVGKALQDPVQGVTALQRVGVRLTESQKDLVQSLVDVGDTAGAQRIILGELQKEFGGSAEAAGKTFAGKLDILKNKFGELQERVGLVIANALTPLVDKFKPIIDKFIEFVDKHPQIVGAFVGIGAAIAATAAVVFILAGAITVLDTVGAPIIATVGAIIALGAAIYMIVDKTVGWQNVWNGIVDTYNTYIKPALTDLWNVIQTQLLPVLQEFWDKNQNWIIPALKFMAEIIGGVILASILGFIGALKIIVEVISWVVSGITWLVEQFKAGFAWIKQGVTGLKDHFWENVGFIIGFFATLPIKIPFYIAAALIAAANFIRNMDWGAILSNIWNAFINLNHRIIDGFHDLVNRIRNIDWGSVGKSIANAVIGFIEGAINGAMKGIPGAPTVHIPRFARGVENFGGGLALVGERGPELVNLPRGSDVIPNNQIGGLSGSTANTTININVGMMTGSAVEQREAAMRIFENLQDIANTKGQSVAQLIGSM